jgi:7-cyano-7-deazaguanine reductase
MTVPAESTHIIESKSFKLYLNSFNATQFVDAQAVRDCMREDLDAALWHGGKILARCGVKIILPEEFDKEPVHELDASIWIAWTLSAHTICLRQNCSRHNKMKPQ